jgi:DNA-directed RNA polymerase subunit M/transcription elongation factor TFIIS
MSHNKTNSIRFCSQCDNKYYHIIDSEGKLAYYCRVCGFQDANISNEALCVLNTQFQNGNSQNLDNIVNRYTKYDPTLPKIVVKCPNDQCSTNSSYKKNKKDDDEKEGVTDAIYVRYDNVNLKYLYICTVCEHKWKTDDTR